LKQLKPTLSLFVLHETATKRLSISAHLQKLKAESQKQDQGAAKIIE